MVVVSYSGKEINAKLVYYGAGLSGKTTNLESIYEAVPDTSRGKMVSMKTQSDRTLFFDLLPLDLGEIMGFKTRFLLYTVPGQVFYNATRKLVLKGADAIVFVADSEVGKMEENKESLANLMTNLAEYGLSIESTPWVIQYNKRDLPNVYSVDELNAELNPGGKVPFFEAVATQGTGVFETFRGISHMLMEKVTRDLRRGPGVGTNRGAVAQAPSAAAAAAAAAKAATALEPAQAVKPEVPVRPFGPTRLDNAAPNAPGLAIEQESRASKPASADRVDYGREIELPSRVSPVAQPEAASIAKAEPAKTDAISKSELVPAVAKAEPAPATAKADPVAAKAEPGTWARQEAVSASASSSAPVRTESPKSGSDGSNVPAGAMTAASGSVGSTPPGPSEKQAPTPTSQDEGRSSKSNGNRSADAIVPAKEAARKTTADTPSIGPAARGGQAASPVEPGTEPIVVPIRIPKGSSREIVLRIVICAEDDNQA